MSRNLDPALAAAVQSGLIQPAILVQLTFRSQTQYVWSGIGPLIWNGLTFKGVGSLGSVGAITEGTEVNADGTSVTLSGIDPTFYAECMSDIQLGAAAKIWFGAWSQGQIVGQPYLNFSGLVDKPVVKIGTQTISITLALENRMTDLQRARNSRYTSADQQVKYPDDTSMHRVELLNDLAMPWGS